jgi:iron complex outermembrane recepter protein
MVFQPKKRLTTQILITQCAAIMFIGAITGNANASKQNASLEELIVTAQKRQQPLQETPIAISVLNDIQLRTLGITSLDGLVNSVIPSLRINPNPNSPSSLGIAIRGDGSADVVQPTRQSAVAIYLDGIYLGRTQGLSMELADLQRIEVLRGPQGTLFGQNSTSGALSLITHKPTGEFGLQQTLGAGRFNEFNSVTRINFPMVAGVSAKLDYVHSEREGWVKNSLANQADYNEFDKDGGRLSLNWQAGDSLAIDYAYDQSELHSAQRYLQLYQGTIGPISNENERQSSTRFPILLKPNIVDIEGHSLVTDWTLSDSLTLKSLTAYRELTEDGFNNYAGTLGYSGFILNEDTTQEQYSQEVQLLGNTHQFDWLVGLYYFKEDTTFDAQNLFSLDNNFNTVNPPIAGDVTHSVGSAKSRAAFAQGTWAFAENLDLTLGLRHTQDDKSAAQQGDASRDINSDHTDGSLALSYQWLDNVSTYIKWASAYKAGGYNVRSADFQPFDDEVNKTWELGFKSEWLDHKLRLNTAFFKSKTKDKQFDFTNPTDVRLVETLNAEKSVEISGAEIDLTAMPIENLVIGLHYTYLDGDMPLQPHPTENGFQAFELIQTPPHAGALTVDYTLAPQSFGTLTAHMDVTSTDRYAHSTVPAPSQDGYMLFNARFTLKEIALGQDEGSLSVSLWGKNLTDEEYATLRFPIGTTVIQAYGDPRTYGVDVRYDY